MTITTVGLDADDTLWHNETVFRLTQARFLDLLTEHENAVIEARLAEIERRNLQLYGYGVKGFTLSMIETAMEMCDGEPLPGVDEALARLSGRYRLVLITKGDLLDQERKLAASGLGDLFAAVEIVSEKDRATYERVFTRHGTGPAEAVMVGNSMKSDVLPALEAGAFAVHIPYVVTWAHELADAPEGHPRYGALDRIDDLPGWIEDRLAQL